MWKRAPAPLADGLLKLAGRGCLETEKGAEEKWWEVKGETGWSGGELNTERSAVESRRTRGKLGGAWGRFNIRV